MKTALELLGYEGMRIPNGFGVEDLELVAQRARDEMREAAANRIITSHDETCAVIAAAIRALPVKP